MIGFGAGRPFDLDDVILKPGPTMQRGFSVITASVVRGTSFHSPDARILVTATGTPSNIFCFRMLVENVRLKLLDHRR